MKNNENPAGRLWAALLGVDYDDPRPHKPVVVKRCTECPRGWDTGKPFTVMCEDSDEERTETVAHPIDTRCGRIFDINGHICIMQPTK